jgi:hypothetical protein
VSSCKKSTPIPVPEPIEPVPAFRSDSVYFEVGGKSYFGKPDLMGMNSYGNSGYRMRYLEVPKDGMKLYSGSGGDNGWYANSDSIYFFCANTYKIGGNNAFQISFSQGFHKKDMYSYGMYYPKDVRNMVKKGKQTFATDIESTNFTNGVALTINGFGRTGKPLYDFKDSIANFSQDDSIFEIINTEQGDEGSYFVEARFELNVYGKERAKSRVKNGYIRFTLKKEPVHGIFLF